jgi:diacylglycerol kinase
MEVETPKQQKKKFTVTSRYHSFRFAVKGMISVFRVEHNMWLHLLAALGVVGASFYFDIERWEWAGVVLSIVLVMCAELFNSAIEKLVDLVSPVYNPAAGLVKDIAAGAVLMAAIGSAVTGSIIFIPRLIALL